MRIVFVAGLVAASLVFGAASASGHSTDELRAWLDEWIERAEVGLDVELLAEWREMAERHPSFFYPSRRTANPSPLGPRVVRRDPSPGAEAWRPLVASYFPAEEVDFAICVIDGESRGDPGAKNPTSSAAGLWQFLRSTWDWVADSTGTPSYDEGGPYDPELATRNAVWLWRTGGWKHWNAARRC